MSSVRCDNCGWGNPSGLERCQKCNQPLSVVLEEPVQSEEQVYCAQCGYPKFSAKDVCANCGASGVVTAQQAQQAMTGAGISLADAKATRMMDFGVEDLDLTPRLERPNIPANVQDSRSTVRMVESAPAPVSSVELEPVQEVKNVNSKSTIRDLSDFCEPKSESVKRLVEGKEENNDLSGLKLVPMDGFDVYGDLSIGCNEGEKVLCRENVDKVNPSIDAAGQASVSFEDGKWYISNLSPLQNTFVCKKRKIELEAGDIVVIGNRRYTVQ